MNTSELTTRRGKSMKAMKLTLGLMMTLALAASVNAQPASQAMLLDAGTGTPTVYNNLTLGYQFNVSTSTQVYAFGVWDGPNGAGGSIGDGLAGSHEVGLWTYNGSTVTLIETATVPSGVAGILVGEYRYISLASPLSLPPLPRGSIYIIGAFYAGDDAVMDNRVSGTVPSYNFLLDGASSPAVDINSRYATGFAVPSIVNNTTINTAFAGPNMLFEPLSPPPPVPVASWLLDDGSGTTPAAMHGGSALNGAFAGSSTTWSTTVPTVSGYVNGQAPDKALVFSGAGAVSVSDNAEIDPTSISVSAWINHNNSGTSTYGIVQKGLSNGGYLLYLSGGKVGFKVQNAGGTTYTALGTSTTTGNVWHFVTGTYNAPSQTLQLYVDGTLQTSTTSATMATTTQPLYIAGANNSTASYFVGTIDEPAVYNYALSGAEVTYLKTHSIRPIFPEDYGALGNGANDDTVAIQQAAQVVENTGGGTLALQPNKTYRLGQQTASALTGQPYYRVINNYLGTGASKAREVLGIYLYNLTGYVCILGQNSTIKLNDGLHFGAFDPSTGLPYGPVPGTVQAVPITNATGGTFTLTFNGSTSGNLTYLDPTLTADMQAALNNLHSVTSVGGSTTVVFSSPNGIPTYTVTFGGSMASHYQPTMTANGASLTGANGVTPSCVPVLAGANVNDTIHPAQFGFACVIWGCADAQIRDVTFDGNMDNLVVGGAVGPTWAPGIISCYNAGLDILDAAPISGSGNQTQIINSAFNHFAFDGMDVEYYNMTISSPTSPVVLTNVTCNYNARTGLAWTGGNSLAATGCTFDHTGKDILPQSTGDGVDIEAECPLISNGSFTNCNFEDNIGAGLGTGAGAGFESNLTFTGCTFWGSTNWSAWVGNPSTWVIGSSPVVVFNSCTFYGSPIVESQAPSPSQGTQFNNCTFTDTGLSPIFNEPGGYVVTSNADAYTVFNGCTVTANQGFGMSLAPMVTAPPPTYTITSGGDTLNNCTVKHTWNGFTPNSWVDWLAGVTVTGTTTFSAPSGLTAIGFVACEPCAVSGNNVTITGSNFYWCYPNNPSYINATILPKNAYQY